MKLKNWSSAEKILFQRPFFEKMDLKCVLSGSIFNSMKNTCRHFSLSLYTLGVLFFLLSGIGYVDQLARSAAVSADISEALSRDKKELSQLFLSSGNSSGRILRSNRQRSGAQGRIFNSRSGGADAPPALSWDEKSFSDVLSLKKGKCFHSAAEYDYLKDFIISALPVRAGPAVGC